MFASANSAESTLGEALMTVEMSRKPVSQGLQSVFSGAPLYHGRVNTTRFDEESRRDSDGFKKGPFWRVEKSTKRTEHVTSP